MATDTKQNETQTHTDSKPGFYGLGIVVHVGEIKTKMTKANRPLWMRKLGCLFGEKVVEFMEFYNEAPTFEPIVGKMHRFDVAGLNLRENSANGVCLSTVA